MPMSTLPTSGGRSADQAAEDRDDWPQSTAIAEWLKRPGTYKEPVSRVALKETHISWVFLTDRFVYKLKKPVRFDFLDFRSVEARHEACQAELRLNQRLARGVYLGVVPICADASGRLSLDGSGQIVDWVVKMRRLPADRMLDELIRNGRLTHEEAMRLAGTLASFYHGLSPVTMGASDYRQSIERHVRANREELLKPLHRLPASLIKRVHAAQLRFLQLQGGQFEDRVCDGRIVEGHGDLRPEHICLDGIPAIFDCIEFNEDFRRLDVVDELGFLAMECDLLGADRIGAQIVDAYRSACHDQFSDELWSFYKCYRACVRAKVAVLRAASPSGDRAASGAAVDYLCLADRYAAALGPPALIVIRGLMGVGKTTLAEALAERWVASSSRPISCEKSCSALRRRRLNSTRTVTGPKIDCASTTSCSCAVEQDLKEGLSVILDGTFLAAELRERGRPGPRRRRPALPGALRLPGQRGRRTHCRKVRRRRDEFRSSGGVV